MFKTAVTQKSVVCGIMALLWIWFLWVFIAQPAGSIEGHPHFDVAETQSSPVPGRKQHTKPKPVIDNEASPYDKPNKGNKPESIYDKPWTPSTDQSTDQADSKADTSLDKPGTANDGKDKDASDKSKTPGVTEDVVPSSTKASAKGRPLVVYAYAESENSRENLKFFIQKGLNGAADFVFMLNGETDADTLIPDDKPNVRIVRRPNTCYDLGGMGEVLRTDDLWKKYSRFITMNSSIRGPFFPVWSNDCWMDRYLDRITDQVKLVGMTVNCNPRLHVQSMIFATDKIGMGLLLDPALATSGSVDDSFGKATDPVGMSSCYNSHDAAVHAEVGTTGIITAAGYHVDVMLTAPHIEATIEMFCAANAGIADFWWDNHYFGGNIHPYETIFFKANRNVDTEFVKAMSDWHLKLKKDSWETCGGSF